MEITRDQVLRFRVHAQQLDREPEAEASTDAAVLDIGVQDTGPDGSLWALEVRGFAPDPADLFTAWTLRGRAARLPPGPGRSRRRCRRAGLGGRRRQAGLRRVSTAEAGRHPGARGPRPDRRRRCGRSSPGRPSRVTCPARSTPRLPEPYQRYCRPCDADAPLRAAVPALARCAAGSSCTPGTSPPVLARIPGWRGMAAKVDRPSTRSGPCSACWVRPRRSRSRPTSTPPSRTSRSTGPRTSRRHVEGEERDLLGR